MAVAVVIVILVLTYYCTSLAPANNLLVLYDDICLCPEDVLVFVVSMLVEQLYASMERNSKPFQLPR